MFVSPLFANWAVVCVISPTAGLVAAIMAMSVLSGVSVCSLLPRISIGEETIGAIGMIDGVVNVTGVGVTVGIGTVEIISVGALIGVDTARGVLSDGTSF